MGDRLKGGYVMAFFLASFFALSFLSMAMASSFSDDLSTMSLFQTEDASSVWEGEAPCNETEEDCEVRRQLLLYSTTVSYNFLNRGYAPRTQKLTRTYYSARYTGAYAALVNGSQFTWVK